MTTQNDLGENLADAFKDFVQSINDLTESVKACRESGMNQEQIQMMLYQSIPDEDKPAFQMMWPYLSMLLTGV